jgi:hypothetical protein
VGFLHAFGLDMGSLRAFALHCFVAGCGKRSKRRVSDVMRQAAIRALACGQYRAGILEFG